jgi:hypothetical protein
VKFQRSLILCAAVLMCSATSAFAVDGVVLIDQARALAGNVTPGDAPGFPVTLSLPGSYRLSANLTVPADTDGIVIQNNEITLDLNVFRIAGVPGEEEQVAGVTDKGVTYRAIVVRNGSMTNFGVVLASHQAEVREMRISAAHFGIKLTGDGGVATVNNLSQNFSGIRVEGKGAIVSDNIATGNFVGIQAYTSVLISKNHASFNTAMGIHAECPSQLIGNIVVNNPINIQSAPFGGCTLVDNNTGTP